MHHHETLKAFALAATLALGVAGCAVEDTPPPVIDDSGREVLPEVGPCCPDGVWREMNPSDGRDPDPNWCTLPGKPLPGLTEPPAHIATLLRAEPLLPAEDISCPSDHSQWLPFVDYTTAGMGGDWILDDDGVVMANTEAFDPGSGYSYAFGSIATYLVRRYGDIVLSGPSTEYVDSLTANADWLVDNAVRTDWEGHEVLNWPYPYPGEETGSPGPWVSAYATSIAVPGLIGAYCITEDERYLAAAGGALRSLSLPSVLGGTATWIDEEQLWMEEGTDIYGLTTRILNGHLAAIAGAWTAGTWGNSELSWALFDAAVTATERDLHLFDPGFISLYLQWSLPEFWPMVAHTSNYNRFHTVELSWLHQATGNNFFLETALKLARYDDPGFEIDTSHTLAGQADYALNRRMMESWTAPSGAWTEWTLTNPQELGGMTMWANRPGERPDSYRLEIRTDEGVEVVERPWPGESCADTFVPLETDAASSVRMQIFREDEGPITMRSAGLHSTRGQPSAVCQFGHHGAINRPVHMFNEEGWYYPRLTWVTIDTQTTYDELTLSWSGWLSQTVNPIVRGADELDDMVPLTGTFRRENDRLWFDLTEVPRYVQVEFPELAYAPERRMWAEGR